MDTKQAYLFTSGFEPSMPPMRKQENTPSSSRVRWDESTPLERGINVGSKLQTCSAERREVIESCRIAPFGCRRIPESDLPFYRS
ncbi:MAG: hypothetical protein GF315_04185 [candidate division Zixibacteria bacterium]|nr:hypothetical protein [candidate division Zixibacteria bacterium]